MQILLIIFFIIIAYLLGSIPGGYLITKLTKKDDIRKYGSKSTGATNTTRVLGFKLGLVAGLIDILKGMVVLILLKGLKLENIYILDNYNILAIFGLAAVIGHIYPIFLNFKGGKAVATSFGIVIFFSPVIALVGLLVFILIASISNYVSLASMISSVCLFLFALLQRIFSFGFNFLNFLPLDLFTLIIIAICVLIIVVRHYENIIRLFNGNENKITDLGIKK